MSALADELGLLRAAMTDGHEADAGGHRFEVGTIGGRDVVVTSVGVGKVNAAMVATLAIDHFSPREVLFTGVAGGIDPVLGIGDVVDHLGYRPSLGLLDRVRSAATGLQLSPVLGRVPNLVLGTVVTGDQFIQSEEERRRLFETFKAQATEMEGAAVAQVAEHFGVDYILIRAVSDRVGVDSAFDFARFLGDVSINSSNVVLGALAAT